MATKQISAKTFAKWTEDKKRKYLDNPSLRSRLSDSSLTPELLKMRKDAVYARTAVTPGSGTTYGDVAKQSKYSQDLTFGAGDRELADRQAQLAAGRARDASWFTAYRNQVDAARTASQNFAQSVVGSNQALVNQMGNVSSADSEKVQAQLRARAAELGQVPQDAQYAQVADQAKQSRAAMTASSAQAQNTQRASAVERMAALVDAAGAAGYANQAGYTARDKALAQDKTDYAEKKGAFKQKFLSDAINEARKQVLEDKLYDIKTQTAEQKAALDASKLAETKRHNKEQERAAQYRLDHPSKGSGGSGSNGKKPKGQKHMTPIQNRAIKIKIGDALAWLNLPASKNQKSSVLRNSLRSKGFDNDVINTAMDIKFLGYIGPVNYRVLHNFGYNVYSWGWKIKK